MNRSNRMFEIIQLLRSARRPLTAQQLADELEVTKRTIYRDIVALQGMRIPIDGEAGIGYIMRPGYDLPPLMFTTEEIEAISVGLTLLGRTADTGLQRAAKTVARKISDVLPQDHSYDWISQTVFTSTWHTIPEASTDPAVIREAIRNFKKLKIEYSDVNQEVSTRTILPLALLYYVDSLVTAAWCELRRDFRHFRVDRMIECTLTDLSFTKSGDELRQRWQQQHQLQ